MCRYLRSSQRTGQLLKSFLNGTRIDWCLRVQANTDPSKFQVVASSDGSKFTHLDMQQLRLALK